MTAAIVQARMASRRFPGKVMVEVAGKPLIEHLLNRLRQAQRVGKILIATTAHPENGPLIKHVKSLGYEVYADRGDENDVLGRYIKASRKYDEVVRITGDCCLIDPVIVDRVIAERGDAEFSTNVMYRTFARGFDTEVMTRDTLKKLDMLCKDDRREHVTLYIYRNAHLFDYVNVFNSTNESEIILCVDYPEDFQRIRQVLEWNPLAPYREIIRFIQRVHESEVDRVSSQYGGAAGNH